MENEHNQANLSLDKDITSGMLMKFALPTIVSMVFMSAFGIVDGIFVSRIIDAYALSAVGLVMPYLIFVLAVGIMFGTGGNALVAKEIGEGQPDLARKDFSLIVSVSFILTGALSVVSLLFPDLILRILGVDAEVYDFAREYMMPMLFFLPFISAGVMFQQFLMTEGKAHLGMIATILGGGVNMVLNWLLIYRLQLGLRGAAIATCVGYSIPAMYGLLYFAGNRKGLLYFVRPKLRLRALAHASLNGLSEMVSMMAMTITTLFMNNILMDLEGPMAVAAAGIIFAMMSSISSVFTGYASGIIPLISFNQGKQDKERLRKIFYESLWIISLMALGTMGLGWLLTDPFIGIYIKEPLLFLHGFYMLLPVYEMSFDGIRLISFGYIFMGINVFGSVLYTGLNDGKTSGLLAFLRTFVFVIVTLIVLPAIWGVNGVWTAIPFAEVLSIPATVYFFISRRKVYHYA